MRAKSRFEPYYDEIDFCWCPLCTELARAHCHHTPSVVDEASEALFKALERGTHKHEGPHVSLVKFDARKYRNDGSEMREGLGIGMTPGGVTGSVRK